MPNLGKYGRKVDDKHVQGAQKGVSIVGKILAVFTPLMLLAIIGLSVAPIAAVHEGWVYYRHNNIANGGAGGRLRMLGGWNKFHSTAVPGQIKNKSVMRSAEIVPAVAVAWLLFSALTALSYLLLSCCTTALSKSKKSKVAKSGKGATGVTQLLLTLLAPLLGLGCIAWAIAAYIVLAVSMASYSRRNLGANYMAWPDWAFFLAIGAGLFWLLLAPLTAFAAATAGTSAATDGKSAKDIPGNESEEAPMQTQQPSYQTQPQPKVMNVQPQNNGYDRSLEMNGTGNQNANGNVNSSTNTTTTTGNRGHLDNMNGFVIDHNRNKGDLSQDKYNNYI